jgi:hypothetical protein
MIQRKRAMLRAVAEHNSLVRADAGYQQSAAARRSAVRSLASTQCCRISMHVAS